MGKRDGDPRRLVVSATFPVSWNRQVFLQSRRDAHEGLSFFPHQFGLNDEQAVDLLTPYFENARRKPPVPQNEAVAA